MYTYNVFSFRMLYVLCLNDELYHFNLLYEQTILCAM